MTSTVKAKRKLSPPVVTVLIVAILLGGAWIYSIAQRAAARAQITGSYDKAVELIAQENYTDAYALLNKLYYSDEYRYYKDTDGLTKYCDSRIKFANGNYYGAYHALTLWGEPHFYDQNPEFLAEYNAFFDQVKEKRDRQNEIDLAKEKREAEQRAIENEKKIKTGVPFVGMSESRIDQTILGKHIKDYTQSKMENGNFIYGRTYIFVQSGKPGKFYATCFNGYVTSVTDDLNVSYTLPSSGKSSSSSGKDEYNAKSYTDVDTFYDDYYDDFADFDEAEQYFDEYGG